MKLKIMRNDFLRKKTITVAVFSLITISTTLVAVGVRVFADLAASIEGLIDASEAPDFAQFHSGPVEEDRIVAWSEANAAAQEVQLVELVNIEEGKLSFRGAEPARKGSVMELAFVKQNESFDFLLDLENRILRLSPGEIALPIFLMRREGLELGDSVSVKEGNFKMDFKVAAFARDVQMNPSIVSSKRLLVSGEDFRILREKVGVLEHLIEFRLSDPALLEEFRTSYVAALLPQNGPSIDIELIRILNGFTDGLVAAAIILVGLILSVVAMLCLRFTIIATLEEDYREIGVMKGIGIGTKDIRGIYLARYFVLLSLGGGVGFILSLGVSGMFLSDMLVYLGAPTRNVFRFVVPALAVLVHLGAALGSCRFVLRRFEGISAAEAIRIGYAGAAAATPTPLRGRRFFHPNRLLALQDALVRFRSFALLFFVFFVSTFIVLVPFNFLSTIKAPDFIKYMGIGRSDIFVDLRRTDAVHERFRAAVEYLERDEDVERFSPRVTCRYAARDSDGAFRDLTVETGDFFSFPLEYLEGSAPLSAADIALSVLSAEDFGVGVGDGLSMLVGGSERELRVTGIYQDLSNGGRTAKAPIEADHGTALWYTIYIDVDAEVSEKIDEFSTAFGPAKITDMRSYLQQTFGTTIAELSSVSAAALTAAILVAMLMAALFLKMLIAKDLTEISILRSLGFSPADIRSQYLTRIVGVLVFGIVIGTAAADVLGQALVGAALSLFGVSRIDFVVDPFRAYLAFPLLFVTLVSAAAFGASRSAGRLSVSDVSNE